MSEPTPPLPPRAARPAPGQVSTHRLPVTGEVFVGREAELARLDRAWADPGIHVISLVAWGGVGKSALINQWLGGMEREGFRGAERVFAWSFYSQGSVERAESADAFFNEALRWFGDPDPAAGTAVQRSERLVGFLRKERTLLVLDGLEPLQHPPGPMEGRLKDPALAVLVKELAAANPGLCVITTREKVAELGSRAETTAPRIDLEHLPPAAGAEVLKKLGVKGLPRELEEAAREIGGHALALTLLGTYLRDACGGDVRRRPEARVLEQDAEQGGHAMRMMASYEEWLGPGPAVAVLRLLGLFDRPADREALAALQAAPPIPGLTEALFAGQRKRGWRGWLGAHDFEPLGEAEIDTALARLRRAGLLAEPSPGDGGALDTHPLVRAYLGDRLKAAHPEAWKEGNRRLYEHLRAAAPDLPDALEEMLPLYAAILHGCRAGRHQEALDEVYRRRIQRGSEFYSSNKLGALGANLAALSGFFDRPWDRLGGGLPAAVQGYVLSEAGFSLRALGRLAEAVAPMQATVDLFVRLKSWGNAARGASNLSDLTLALGDLAQTVAQAERSVEFADLSENEPQKMICRTVLADAAHQAGQVSEAEALFQEAESMQERREPEYPRLYSVQGYQYCDLLLGRIESALAGPSPALPLDEVERLGAACREVRQRAEQLLGWASRMRSASLLDVALYHLALGRAHLAAHQLQVLPADLGAPGADSLALAAHYLDQAVDGLRRAGQEDYLPHGLLTRAVLRRVQGDFPATAGDLAEASGIAERGGMRLHACDAHLESVRLALSTGDPAAAQSHLAAARALVEATGYHRRDPEVAGLAAALDRAFQEGARSETEPAAVPAAAAQEKEGPMKDFFVSYNRADRAWAEWIAWVLEEAGYSVVLQSWDFRPGGNFVLEMQKATTESQHTAMVLSDSYLQALYTQPEWAAAFAQDPRGEQRKLIPFRVAPCEPTGLLRPLIYVDLVGLSEPEAEAAVQGALRNRAKPPTRPPFPGAGATHEAVPQAVAFPATPVMAGSPPGGTPPQPPRSTGSQEPQGALALWREKLDYLLEQEAIAADPAQKFALRKQVEEARRKIQELGG